MHTPEVDLSADLLPQHGRALQGLGLLASSVPTANWCLVGGLMVVVAGSLAGHTDRRAQRTKDADIVVDVVADPEVLGAASRALQGFGFETPPEAWTDDGVARCTLVAGRAQIDLLAPDDAEEAQLRVGDELVSLAIPGGRRALQLAVPVRIVYDHDAFDVVVRVPKLPGALVVKAAAATFPRTEHQLRHIQDVAFLLSAVDDPRALLKALDPTDRERLASLRSQLDDPGSPAWEYLDADARARALAVLEFV